MIILFQLPTFWNAIFNLFKMVLPKKMTERLVLVGSDQTTWVSVVQFLLGFRIIPAVIRHFRLHEHFPNCCLPQALGGDVPETNVHDFYEFCTENAQVVEKKYQYLKFWSKKEQSLQTLVQQTLWIFWHCLFCLW